MRVPSMMIDPDNDVRVCCQSDTLELTYTEPRKTPNENSATPSHFILSNLNYSN